MSKSEEVKAQLERLRTRVIHLTESRRRLNIFDGMNDGKTLADTTKRLKTAEKKLKQYINDNVEYVL